MPLNLPPSALNPKKVKKNPLTSDLTALGPARIVLEYNLRGKDLYTLGQERALLTKAFDTGKLSAAPFKTPALETDPNENNQSWWAAKNILLTSILSRENPAELKQLENIPDLAAKITAQDVLHLVLLQKWDSLDFLVHKGLRLDELFEQPAQEAQNVYSLKPSKLIKHMASSNDTEGLIFLLANGVDFNRVFTAEEINELKTQSPDLLLTLEEYGLKTGNLYPETHTSAVRNRIIMSCVESLLRAKPEIKAETAFAAAQKLLASDPQIDITAFRTNLEKEIEIFQINKVFDNPQKVERLLTRSKYPLLLAQSIVSKTLLNIIGYPVQNHTQVARLIAQTFERENATQDLNDMLAKLEAYNSSYSLACELIDTYHADVNYAFRQFFRRDSFTKAARGHFDFLQLYLERGADANQLVRYEGNMVHPLMLVTKEQLPEAVDLLASFDADINTPDERGNTPAHLAMYNADRASLDILAKYGANFDIPNAEGVTVRDLLKENIKTKRLKLDFRGAKEISQLLER